jgi:hypothetical protein
VQTAAIVARLTRMFIRDNLTIGPEELLGAVHGTMMI